MSHFKFQPFDILNNNSNNRRTPIRHRYRRTDTHSIADFPDHYLKHRRSSEYSQSRIGDYRVIIDWQRNENSEILFI
ncbi:hypothetical protein SAMN04487948_11038 [Halogranum amylolyticum]|uniref:Uncharacterized protein n=1 Tax=Halogranum amylolyticum TaxID=660520 RepID=A0A1H8U9E4_9EURY|nr:hypothetical protein SAMN04487948_11038 [Halogranum amylolyticum]